MNNSEILQPKESDKSHYFFEGANGLRLQSHWNRIMKKVRKAEYELDRLKEFRSIGAVKRRELRETKYKRLRTLIEKYLNELENIIAQDNQEVPNTDRQKLKNILRKSLITTIREFTWRNRMYDKEV